MGFITRLLGRMFGLEQFGRIVLTQDATTQVVGFARRAHPNEFSALLGGSIRDKTLYLTHIIYQHFEATERSATMHIDTPVTAGARGTVHSHPSHDNLPSAADKRFFNKYSMPNFIIAHPYLPSTIACYDGYGRPLSFTLVGKHKTYNR